MIKNNFNLHKNVKSDNMFWMEKYFIFTLKVKKDDIILSFNQKIRDYLGRTFT